jgi:hypothetical protein
MNHTLITTVTGQPIANLRVEAWDATGIVDDLIDVAVSDARGRFRMEVDDYYVAAVFSGGNPTVVFQIYDGTNLVAQTKAVSWQLVWQSTQLQNSLATSADRGSQHREECAGRHQSRRCRQRKIRFTPRRLTSCQRKHKRMLLLPLHRSRR